MKTLLVVVVLLAAAAGGGFWYWKNRGTDAPDYKTVAVSKGDLVQTVTATGQINPVTNVTVGSQISGIISRLYVDFNSPVTNGQLVAEIDPQTYSAVVAQNRGDLASAEAQLALDKVNLDRSQALLTNKILAQSDYDQAKATYDQADAMVQIKKASLQQALVNLAYTKIYAPIDGIVLSRNVDVGQTVAASFSAPTLFVIANDTSKMQIEALVSEADIGSVETNQAVNFTVDAYPGRNFRGVVTQIRNLPQTNQNVINYDTLIAVENKEKILRPGMTANVAIVTSETNDVLRIPNTALRYRPPDVADTSTGPGAAGGSMGNGGAAPMAGRGNTGEAGSGQRRGDGSGRGGAGGGQRRGGRPAKTVYVLADDPSGKGKIAKPAQIHTGIGDGVYTEVKDGLNEGDQVIIGQTSAVASSTSGPPPSNPFGGGQRRF